jgi:short-subunit dehydrogenase
MHIYLKPLKEQVIVITGASSGIGLATAETAAKRGAMLVLCARSEATLKQVVYRIKDAGGDATAVVCDVADPSQVERVAKAAVAYFGRIDTWINNAGLGMYGLLEKTDIADGHRLFEVNFWGVVNGSLTALPYLRKQGGALINVGSEVSEAATPLLGMYTASKHAVKGFTDSLRLEVEEIEKAPVAITLIQPTAVNTPFPQHARNYMTTDARLPEPMIDPQQVADAILEAAVTHTRDKKVGVMALVNTAMARFAPTIADRMAARQSDQLHCDEPPNDPDGALYRPSEVMHVSGHKHPLPVEYPSV